MKILPDRLKPAVYSISKSLPEGSEIILANFTNMCYTVFIKIRGFVKKLKNTGIREDLWNRRYTSGIFLCCSRN